MRPEIATVHETVELVSPWDGPVAIDQRIAPVILALWDRGLNTIGCCQDVGESILRGGQYYQPTEDLRRRRAAFYAEYAWIKMPAADGQRMIAIVSELPEFDKRLKGWAYPGAWECYIYVRRSGGLADATQLYLPADQLEELATALSAAK